MLNGKTGNKLTKLSLSLFLTTVFLIPEYIHAAKTDKPDTIGDIKPPFTFSIHSLTPDGKPQPGVKIRCLHPRAQRGKAIIDTVATSDEKGVATFNLTRADVILDRYFWFSPADERFVGGSRVGISPIDKQFKWTFKVLPAASFKISVRDQDGKPIPQAKINLFADHPTFPGFDRSAFRAYASATTDEAGLADIKYAKVKTNIIASADGLAATFVRGASLPEDEPYQITLQSGCSITGKVVDPEGNPIAGVKLSSKNKDLE